MLDLQEFDYVPVFDFEIWQHRRQKHLNVLVDMLLLEGRQAIEELVEIGAANIQLEPGVEALHFGLPLIDRERARWIDQLLPDLLLVLWVRQRSHARVPHVYRQV